MPHERCGGGRGQKFLRAPAARDKPCEHARSAHLTSSSPAPADDAGEALDWKEFEVSESDLAQTHPSWAELVKLDVCILPAAFPTWALPSDGKVGWRAQVTAKRGSEKKGTQQILVCGAWFSLTDQDRVKPIKQLEEEEEDESEEDEGEEEDEEDEGESEEEESDAEEGEESADEDTRTWMSMAAQRLSSGPVPPHAIDSSDEEGAHANTPKRQKL